MSFDTIPADYIQQLYDHGKQKKARAALEFFFFSERVEYPSSNKWAELWSVSKSTSWKWCEGFKAEEERHYRETMAQRRRF